MRLIAILCGWAMILAGATVVRAGENYAFPVAVADYDPKQLHKLAYSRNDILEFHDALLASGFKKKTSR